MKVAVSATSEDIKQPVNPVFGRCPGYIIAEIDEKKVMKTKFVQNPGASSGTGAGIAAAQAVVSQAVQAVISGNFGPNAFMVLQQAGIKIYGTVGLTVEQALQQLAEGKLEEAGNSTVPGHFGMGAGRGFGLGARGETDRGLGAGRGMGQGLGAGRNSGRGRGRRTGVGKGAGRGKGQSMQ